MALFVVIVAAGILFFGFGSPEIVEIEIEGGGRIGTSKIAALSGFNIGEPWNASYRESAKNEILSLLEVKDVQISGRLTLPFGIHVHMEIDEREPLAIVSLSQSETYWVDQTGLLLGRVQQSESAPSLPLLTDVSVEESANGRRFVSEELMDVVSEIMRSPGRLLSQFREIKVNVYDLELLSHDGWSALIQTSDLRKQLSRLDVVLLALEREAISDWKVIDLRFQGEVTLR